MAKHKIKPVDTDPQFVAEEEKLLKYWYESGIVEKYLHKNDKSSKRFSFFDGPITANNPMGVHHGWGRTYKDLWQRYHNLKGYKQRFQNGFDCQGLWVEVEVEKELGFKSKKDIAKYGVAKFVQKCKDRVKQYAAIQTEQSKRLGYFMDWDNSYFTMSDANNYMIWHFLKVCHQHGWIYKGTDSVPWCPRCETAISQHEMLTEDYKQISHASVYLALPIVDQDKNHLLVWTTTPWTIPANIAVAVDPKLDYSLVEINGKGYWLAQAAVARFLADQPHTIVKTVSGKNLVGLKYSGPFDDLPAVAKVADNPKFHTVVATDPLILPITTDEGTGLVHTAVSAGSEDFKLGKKYDLPMIPVIADDASYLDGFDWLSGQNAKKHPELIIDYLKKTDNYLLKTENYLHRYPACWRCKTELVWKVTDEWYVAMDKPSNSNLKSQNSKTLRQRMIAVAKKIKWLPAFGLDRELDWLNNMHDWLISKKNRYWGLALPIWKCNHCGHFDVIGSKDELEQRAVSGWDQFAGKSPHKPQVDAVKIDCPKCHQPMSRIEPVGNPWLDAGIIPFSTLYYTTDKSYWQQWFPADFITESFPGQFKNWFYALIAMSTVLEDTPPFKTVLGYASLLAEDGRPMHKSWGNAIEFNEGAGKIGVDIMRWLYARQNPTQNLLFGYHTAAEVKRQFHLILWNSYRFFANYAALDQWLPQPLSPTHLSVLDQWILARLDQTVIEVTRALDKYSTFHATQSLETFVNDLSTWYIRRSRDRIGPTAADAKDKSATYATLHTTLTILSRLLAPFIPFISDRMYTNLTGELSVHLADWPQVPQPLDSKSKQLIADMALVRQIVEAGHGQRKLTQIKVRQPLAQVTVSAPQSIPNHLCYLICDELNVKQVIFKKATSIKVVLDTNITPALRSEGEAREIIRTIQQARKDAGTALDALVSVELPSWPKNFEAAIKRQALVKHLTVGPSIKIIR